MNAVIRSELLAVVPLDRLEQEHLSDALAWAASGAPLCRIEKPATPPKHLVSYFVVLDGDELLLVDHKNAGLWLPSGGHVQPGEHPRQTVSREIKEELNLSVAASQVGPPLMVTCTETVGATPGHTDVSLWYTVDGDRRRPLEFDQTEFNSVRWFRFDAAPLQRADPHLGRFLQKLAHQRGG
jgi:ADP-ribose pyrophosphatase YjhB (NUDIX family)